MSDIGIAQSVIQYMQDTGVENNDGYYRETINRSKIRGFLITIWRTLEEWGGRKEEYRHLYKSEILKKHTKIFVLRKSN